MNKSLKSPFGFNFSFLSSKSCVYKDNKSQMNIKMKFDMFNSICKFMKRQEGNLMDFIMSDFTCERDNEYVIEKGKSKIFPSSCVFFPLSLGTTNCIIINHEPPSHLNLHNVFPHCVWDKVTTANEKKVGMLKIFRMSLFSHAVACKMILFNYKLKFNFPSFYS